MTIKQKFRLFIYFFIATLYISYGVVYGMPLTLLQAGIATLSVAFLTTLITLVFVLTSLVFGLPIDKILKQIR